MLRGIVLAALGALLIATGAKAECLTPETVVAKLTAALPGVAHVVYDGRDRDSILDGMQKVNTAPPADGLTFLVFSHPDKGTVLVVGVRNGCVEGHFDVPRSVLDGWLIRQGASQ